MLFPTARNRKRMSTVHTGYKTAAEDAKLKLWWKKLVPLQKKKKKPVKAIYVVSHFVEVDFNRCSLWLSATKQELG